MMTTDAGPDLAWPRLLGEQLGWHWREHLRPRLEGLTDEEHVWEPVAGCWSVRPRADARTPVAAGAGDVVIEFDPDPPSPTPVTTIAWRIGHLAVDCFGFRAHHQFGAPAISYDTVDWSPAAADGLALLDRTYGDWMAGVEALSPAELARPCGPSEGPFADAPLAELVLHVHREAIHHLAEIALLRDLFAHRDGAEGVRR